MDAGSARERIGRLISGISPPNSWRDAGPAATLDRDFQRDKQREPAPRERQTVSACSIVRASRIRGAI